MKYWKHTELFASTVSRFSSCESFSCLMQVLVVDRPDGPAAILVDTMSLLLNRQISVTVLDDHVEALQALDDYAFDLVVVGLHEQRPTQLTILPRLQQRCPDLPVLGVGDNLPVLQQQHARNYGAREVVNLPERAADLKRLMAYLADRYLSVVV